VRRQAVAIRFRRTIIVRLHTGAAACTILY